MIGAEEARLHEPAACGLASVDKRWPLSPKVRVRFVAFLSSPSPLACGTSTMYLQHQKLTCIRISTRVVVAVLAVSSRLLLPSASGSWSCQGPNSRAEGTGISQIFERGKRRRGRDRSIGRGRGRSKRGRGSNTLDSPSKFCSPRAPNPAMTQPVVTSCCPLLLSSHATG